MYVSDLSLSGLNLPASRVLQVDLQLQTDTYTVHYFRERIYTLSDRVNDQKHV